MAYRTTREASKSHDKAFHAAMTVYLEARPEETALGARLSRNDIHAAGRPWPVDREGRPFSTCALAFSESWTEAR